MALHGIVFSTWVTVAPISYFVVAISVYFGWAPVLVVAIMVEGTGTVLHAFHYEGKYASLVQFLASSVKISS